MILLAMLVWPSAQWRLITYERDVGFITLMLSHKPKADLQEGNEIFSSMMSLVEK